MPKMTWNLFWDFMADYHRLLIADIKGNIPKNVFVHVSKLFLICLDQGSHQKTCLFWSKWSHVPMLSWDGKKSRLSRHSIRPADAHMGIFGMVNLIWSWWFFGAYHWDCARSWPIFISPLSMDPIRKSGYPQNCRENPWFPALAPLTKFSPACRQSINEACSIAKSGIRNFSFSTPEILWFLPAKIIFRFVY